jgi:hypothetical protein
MNKLYSFFFISILILTGCSKAENNSEKQISFDVEKTEVTSGNAGKQADDAVSSEAGRNHPPQLKSLDSMPERPNVGDTITVSPLVMDPDGDPVTFTYTWHKGDELLPEESDTLVVSKERFRRGDVIMLTVIPSDGKDEGNTGILKIRLANTPPEITSSPSDGKYEKRKFLYKVDATDKNEDQLSFSLKTSPAGMRIDENAGLIEWNVPDDFRGNAPVTVSVKDDFGGEAIQSFTFELNP